MGNNTSYIVLLITYLHNGINTPSLSSCQHCPPIGHQAVHTVFWLVRWHYATPTPSNSIKHTPCHPLLGVWRGQLSVLYYYYIVVVLNIQKCCLLFWSFFQIVFLCSTLHLQSTKYKRKWNSKSISFYFRDFLYFEADFSYLRLILERKSEEVLVWYFVRGLG